MRSGLESTSGARLRALGAERQLGRARAEPAPGQQARDVDGIQHRQLASAVRHPDAGVGDEHVAVRAVDLGSRWASALRSGRAIRTGIYFGGNEMLMTPRQMVALGELYLHDGRARGQQVVPPTG